LKTEHPNHSKATTGAIYIKIDINHINMKMVPNLILESAAEKYLVLEIVGIIA